MHPKPKAKVLTTQAPWHLGTLNIDNPCRLAIWFPIVDGKTLASDILTKGVLHLIGLWTFGILAWNPGGGIRMLRHLTCRTLTLLEIAWLTPWIDAPHETLGFNTFQYTKDYPNCGCWHRKLSFAAFTAYRIKVKKATVLTQQAWSKPNRLSAAKYIAQVFELHHRGRVFPIGRRRNYSRMLSHKKICFQKYPRHWCGYHCRMFQRLPSPFYETYSSIVGYCVGEQSYCPLTWAWYRSYGLVQYTAVYFRRLVRDYLGCMYQPYRSLGTNRAIRTVQATKRTQ